MSELLPRIELGPADADSAVIVLHGLGASGDDFVPIVPMLGLPRTRFLFPQAPSRPVTINGGWVMPAWYDIKTLGRGPDREEERDIRDAAARLEALLRHERDRGVPSSRIVLAGFSQGGAMALHVAWRYPERLAGAVVLSGYPVLAATFADEASAANADLPWFVGHGRRDDVVPYRSGERVRDLLVAGGRPVTFRAYDVAHNVDPDEIRDIAAWLRERIGAPPAG